MGAWADAVHPCTTRVELPDVGRNRAVAVGTGPQHVVAAVAGEVGGGVGAGDLVAVAVGGIGGMAAEIWAARPLGVGQLPFVYVSRGGVEPQDAVGALAGP